MVEEDDRRCGDAKILLTEPQVIYCCRYTPLGFCTRRVRATMVWARSEGNLGNWKASPREMMWGNRSFCQNLRDSSSLPCSSSSSLVNRLCGTLWLSAFLSSERGISTHGENASDNTRDGKDLPQSTEATNKINYKVPGKNYSLKFFIIPALVYSECSRSFLMHIN